jgi:hypothetical protein
MIEQIGDIWAAQGSKDWVCITTCGTLRKDGCLVMGAGIAKEAATRYPWLQKAAGEALVRNGLQVEFFNKDRLILFPTKFQYYEDSNLSLIENSAFQLTVKLNRMNLLGPAGILLPPTRMLIPRPGCGNGRRGWAEVAPILDKYLVGDGYVIFNNGKNSQNEQAQ